MGYLYLILLYLVRIWVFFKVIFWRYFVFIFLFYYLYLLLILTKEIRDKLLCATVMDTTPSTKEIRDKLPYTTYGCEMTPLSSG